uniref:Uncharacterized protein n=1 Tax=Cacopsylla melanoneura TaxID=428564 RepID=A0A8D8ZB58_9HEMI
MLCQISRKRDFLFSIDGNALATKTSNFPGIINNSICHVREIFSNFGKTGRSEEGGIPTRGEREGYLGEEGGIPRRGERDSYRLYFILVSVHVHCIMGLLCPAPTF